MDEHPLRTYLAAMSVVVLLAALGIVWAEARRNATFAPGSPQRMVQDYLKAISADDKVRAFAYVASESPCTQQDMDRAFGAAIERTIVQFAQIQGERGRLGIRLELAAGNIFGGQRSSDRTFEVVNEAGRWRLTGQIWPMETCGTP